MENSHHLYLLKEEGVKAWNRWRRNNPGIIPDLSKADLSETILSGADLSEAYLSEANLCGARLYGTDLLGADLNGADLSRADLTNATLVGADLPRANLSGTNLNKSSLAGANLSFARLNGANLFGADLTKTNFSGARLPETDLTMTRLWETVFGDSDLKATKGLEHCQHDGPSTIDIRSLRKSWPLPLSFLRGCGLDDAFINHLPTLISQTSQFFSCFISYSTNDQTFAECLHADLQERGVRCWFAPEDIQAGKKVHRQIMDAIDTHDKLLLILSEHSMGSNWVEMEIRNARKRERQEGCQVLFPVRLVRYETLQDWALFDADEGRDLAAEVREYFIPDFSAWPDPDAYQQAFQRLLRDLNVNPF